MSRKLRCDRTFPSCTRCSKAGLASSCRYETDPTEPKHGQEDSVTDDDYENLHARYPPSDGLTSRPIAGEASATSSQSRRIAQLEDRIASLEAALTNQAFSTPSNHHPMSPASIMDTSRSIENLESMKQGSKERETMIFRKGSFESQYYGATNDRAQLVHVRITLTSAC